MPESADAPRTETLLIDDFSASEQSSLDTCWQFFSDQVMGGISTGTARHHREEGSYFLTLSGEVSLDNNGGFVQMTLDLAHDGDYLDAGSATGVIVTLSGDGSRYAINLRSADTHRPWQSYRCPVPSSPTWQTHYLPFSEFEPHRLDAPLDTARLRRIGLIAIGEAGPVAVSLKRLALYQESRRAEG